MSSDDPWTPIHAKGQDWIVSNLTTMLLLARDISQCAISLLHENACFEDDLRRLTKAHKAARTEAEQLGERVRQLEAENVRLRTRAHDDRSSR